MLLGQDGSVWAAGYNLYGQLGDGSYVNRNLFLRVITAASSGVVVAIAAGGFHSMVLKEDGSLLVTGSNEHGQFGDSSTVSENTFVTLAARENGTRRGVAGFILHSICERVYLLSYMSALCQSIHRRHRDWAHEEKGSSVRWEETSTKG